MCPGEGDGQMGCPGQEMVRIISLFPLSLKINHSSSSALLHLIIEAAFHAVRVNRFS